MAGKAKREIILKLFVRRQVRLQDVFPTGEDAEVAIDTEAEFDQPARFGGCKSRVEKRSGIAYLKTEGFW